MAECGRSHDRNLPIPVSLTCAINITTHNRLGDLQQTLGTIAKLNPQPDEIVVCADACTDGTVEYLKTLPNVKLMVNEFSLGSIGSRDAMIRACTSDIILSFDDDSQPVETDFVAKVRGLFEANPKLAVASFPQFSNEFPESLDRSDFGPSHFIGSYASSSAAIRRSAFLTLGGYCTLFYHVYEEPDFALRCVAAGLQVRFETSLHVRHYYSGVQRREVRIHHFQARNELWSVMMRCPAPYCIGVALFRIARQFGYAFTRGWFSWSVREPFWWMSFLAGLADCLALRNPVPWEAYKRWLKLVSDPAASQGNFEKHAEAES